MNAVDGQDINRTLEYRTIAHIVRLLPTGLLLIFLGLFILVLADPAPIWTIVGAAFCLIVGFGLVGLALWRRIDHGKPLFALSPDGICYRIAAWGENLQMPQLYAALVLVAAAAVVVNELLRAAESRLGAWRQAP